LSLAIALDQHGILLAVLFLVMRMFVPPLLLAIANDLAIFRIYFELPSVIVSATPTLALRLVVDGRENAEKRTCSRHSSRSGARRLLREFHETNL
jgi:hypothetical protein